MPMSGNNKEENRSEFAPKTKGKNDWKTNLHKTISHTISFYESMNLLTIHWSTQ
jgi:hypothetical protein